MNREGLLGVRWTPLRAESRVAKLAVGKPPTRVSRPKILPTGAYCLHQRCNSAHSRLVTVDSFFFGGVRTVRAGGSFCKPFPASVPRDDRLSYCLPLHTAVPPPTEHPNPASQMQALNLGHFCCACWSRITNKLIPNSREKGLHIPVRMF